MSKELEDEKLKELMQNDEQRKKRKKLVNKLFEGVIFSCTLFGVIILVVLIMRVLGDGLGWLDWQYITSLPSRFPEQAGIKSAFAGSVWLIVLVGLISFPLGVGTAIYLEEYADDDSWFFTILELNIANLAGVPSVVYGLLGLAFFVRFLALGTSVLAGAATLSLLVLPIIIVSAQESLKAVPDTLREGAYALGFTKWETIKGVVFPYAAPGIFTGVILALSRAMGEAAPLILVGAAGYVPFLPRGPLDSYTVLPLQIYNWTTRPQAEFQNVAAAGIIVLLIILLSANAIAIVLRNKYQKTLDG